MIPCKDCITFAICKVQVAHSRSSIFGAIVNILRSKCSIVKEYTKPEPNTDFLYYSLEKVQKVADYYKEVMK